MNGSGAPWHLRGSGWRDGFDGGSRHRVRFPGGYRGCTHMYSAVAEGDVEVRTVAHACNAHIRPLSFQPAAHTTVLLEA